MTPRRSFMRWIASLCSAGAVASQTEPEAPCLTPAYAGFDGSFLLYQSGIRLYTVRLMRASASSPKRWGLDKGRMAYWYNADKSVSKLVYRNKDGRLFDLQFVPMDEPA